MQTSHTKDTRRPKSTYGILTDLARGDANIVMGFRGRNDPPGLELAPRIPKNLPCGAFRLNSRNPTVAARCSTTMTLPLRRSAAKNVHSKPSLAPSRSLGTHIFNDPGVAHLNVFVKLDDPGHATEVNASPDEKGSLLIALENIVEHQQNILLARIHGNERQLEAVHVVE
jgi:hypothetical protein